MYGWIDGWMDRLIEEGRIFCRATPEDKHKLLQALQALGHTVAVSNST